MVRIEDVVEDDVYLSALKKKRVPKYIEEPYGGTIYNVINLAKEHYVFGCYSSDMFVHDCVKIVKDKIRNLPKAAEPGDE